MLHDACFMYSTLASEQKNVFSIQCPIFTKTFYVTLQLLYYAC